MASDYILLYARPHHNVVHSDDRYVVLESSTLRMIENPWRFLVSGTWHLDGEELPPRTVRVLRESSRYDEKKEYLSSLKQTRQFIRSPRHGDIYVCTLTDANKILQSHYYKVCHGEDSECRWHVCKMDIALPVALPVPSAPPVGEVETPPVGEVETPPVGEVETQPVGGVETLPVGEVETPPVGEVETPPPAVQKIPQHIFHYFVDSAIEKKEECPITMEPLTRETVAGTACGHLFDYEAISQILRTSGYCPTCRSKCEERSLQRP